MLRIITTISLLVLCLTLTLQDIQADDSRSFSGGVKVGYSGGPGFQLYGMVNNVAENFPMNIRFGFGYTWVEPGKSAEARKVFINDATNGVPEEKGRQIDYRLDLLYPVNVLNIKRAYLFAGPRHISFTGNFKYIGGNEDFDITSKQWGLGTGFESFFAISEKLDLVMSFGVDYYFESKLSGHDTEYAPDGDHSNPRTGYDYDDADDAVNQPTVEPRAMIGVAYNF